MTKEKSKEFDQNYQRLKEFDQINIKTLSVPNGNIKMDNKSYTTYSDITIVQEEINRSYINQENEHFEVRQCMLDITLSVFTVAP